MRFFISTAAAVLRAGGVVSCPTEGVFGLSCMPDNAAAILRLLAIKQRDPAMGLILIAACAEQLTDWIAVSPQQLPEPIEKQPITWIVPAAIGVSPLVRGRHSGVAVRITSNPIARELCRAVDSPLVSTSANLSGQPVARNQLVLRRKLASRVDYVVPGLCGPARAASEIRVLQTGQQLR